MTPGEAKGKILLECFREALKQIIRKHSRFLLKLSVTEVCVEDMMIFYVNTRARDIPDADAAEWFYKRAKAELENFLLKVDEIGT